MRVAHVSYEYPPQSTGGLGTYLQALIAHQRERGDIVDLLYLGEPPVPPGCIPLPAFDHGELLRYSTDDIKTRTGRLDYDVVVCQDWPGVVASQALWKNGTPLVHTCHLPLAWDIGWYDDIPCVHAVEAEFSGFAHSDLIIAVSRSVEEDLHRRFSFTRGKTRVVLNGTDTAYFAPAPARHREPETILYVGRFYEQKGFDLLPDIFALVKENHPAAVLEIIGIGELDVDARKRFQALGLSDDVVWHEFSTLDVVRGLYQCATVVLIPSRLEPFGLVAAEAMACGTPVVASDTGGLSEIIRHRTTGLLVPPEDVPDFARQVSAVLTDPVMASRIGKQARVAAVRSLSQTVSFDRTREVFLDLVSRREG